MFAPAENAADGGEHFGRGGEGSTAGGERVVWAGGFVGGLAAGGTPLAQGGEGGAPGAAFDGAAGDVGDAKAVETQPRVFHHPTGHVHHQPRLELAEQQIVEHLAKAGAQKSQPRVAFQRYAFGL